MDGQSILKRWKNVGEGTWQNNSVTSGEGGRAYEYVKIVGSNS